MAIQQIDLQGQYQSIKEEMDKAVLDVMKSGYFILGPNVAKLEQEIAAYMGVKHAVGVASGTDSLLLAMRALGIGPGDEVIVPAFTFFATAEVVSMVGAKPVLVDVEPETYCLDIAKLQEAVTPRTKAIIPVHLFGHPSDMGPIMDFARQHKLKVVEDNAQAIGAKYKGQRTGGIGDIGCLSFYPTKNLGAYGDGGMLVTNDDAVARAVRMLRTHGWEKKYYSEMVGYNSRLDEIQAAILRVKLPHLDAWNEERRRVAASYDELLTIPHVGLPHEKPFGYHVYHLYVIEVNKREAIAQELSKAGVATAVYYPYALHMMPVYKDLGYKKGDFPVSEAASERCLALPLFPEMTGDQVAAVAKAFREASKRVQLS